MNSAQSLVLSGNLTCLEISLAASEQNLLFTARLYKSCMLAWLHVQMHSTSDLKGGPVVPFPGVRVPWLLLPRSAAHSMAGTLHEEVCRD